MPRRPSPDRCQFCRRRKKKCDGQHPCFACSKAKIECVYAIPPAPASSDFLGQKSAQNSLKPRPKAKKTSETLRKGDGTHGSFEAPPETALSHRGSLPANDSRPGSRPSIELATRSKEPKPRLPVVVDSSAASQQSVSTSDADDLSDHSASAAASAAVSPPRPPPPPPLPYASPHIDWPQARVLRVLDNILQWDCVALCLVDRERFRWGLLHAGPGPSPGRPGSAAATALCTPALVDALLALSVAVFRHNVVDEVANRATGKPAWDVLSAALADEAVRALHRGPAWPPESLPDVQALGVLALYCACRGWRDETRNFAMDFSEAIRKYCVRTAPRPGLAVVPPAATRRITASTYCGAISMNRMLIQIQRCRPGLPSTRTENTNPSDRCDNQSWTEHLLRPIIAHELVVATSELRGDEMYLVAAELYQLVEQVFRTCCVPEQDRTFAEATATYIQGLEWYQNFFKYSEDYTGREPVILFVHTYYHFCILSLFTPYMMDETVVGNGGSPPGKICEEAANSILKLMRHHESLAGDTEAVGFMQSFKSASLEFLDVYKQTS